MPHTKNPQNVSMENGIATHQTRPSLLAGKENGKWEKREARQQQTGRLRENCAARTHTKLKWRENSRHSCSSSAQACGFPPQFFQPKVNKAKRNENSN